MDRSTPPTVTKGRLLNAIEDMTDLLDGLSRLKPADVPVAASSPPSAATAAFTPADDDNATSVAKRTSVTPTADGLHFDEAAEIEAQQKPVPSPASGEPADRERHRLSITGSPPDSSASGAPADKSNGRRIAPLAQNDPELSDSEAQTDPVRMAAVLSLEKGVQTSPGAVNNPTVDDSTQTTAFDVPVNHANSAQNAIVNACPTVSKHDFDDSDGGGAGGVWRAFRKNACGGRSRTTAAGSATSGSVKDVESGRDSDSMSATACSVATVAVSSQPSLGHLWKGLLFASLSALFFSICSVIVKRLRYIHVAQLAAVRFSGILLLSFPAAMTRPEPLFGATGTARLMLAVRAVAGATSLALRFYAFQRMPLGDASTIVFSVPIFVTVFARVFLHEACSVFHVVTCVLTIVGIALISKLPMLFGDPDLNQNIIDVSPPSPIVTTDLLYDSASNSSESDAFTGVPPLFDPADAEDAILPEFENNRAAGEYDPRERMYGTLAALSSCVFAATVIILLRKLKQTDPYVIMFNFGWIALVLTSTATLLLQPGGFIKPANLTDAGLLVLLAVLSFFGQLALTCSLRSEQAGPVSVMRATVDIVLVFSWQVLFFHEVPDLVTIAGAALVMTCVLLTGFRKWALSLPEQSNTRRKLACCL